MGIPNCIKNTGAYRSDKSKIIAQFTKIHEKEDGNSITAVLAVLLK